MGLRLLLYDATCTGRDGLPLSFAWRAGSAIYAGLGRIDLARGAATWDEGLRWLADVRAGEPISEIQYWGHGRWGRLLMDRVALDRAVLRGEHPLRAPLQAVRDRLAPGALWWFRTCETFGAEAGQAFARDWTDFMGCAAAGHTHVIGVWQSGLQLLRPGEEPGWSSADGLREGTPAAPRRAWGSAPWRPRTIHCLQGRVPGFR